MAEIKPPTHTAYAIKRDGRNLRWVEIGAASVHDDGKGFIVYLDRLPVGGFNGRILVRSNDEPPAEPGTSPGRPSLDEDF